MKWIDAMLLGPEYVDELYQAYVRDADAVAPEWAAAFRTLATGESAPTDAVPQFLTTNGGLPDGVAAESPSAGLQIYDLVHTYREYGHMIADIDPLGRHQRSHPFLDMSAFGFREADLDSSVRCAGFHALGEGTVRQFLEVLRETYCGPIGVEYMDIMESEERDWLQKRMEPIRNRPRFTQSKKRALLSNLIDAEYFERTLQAMYPTSKRFSLEGGTTLITLLQEIIDESFAARVDTLVIGMAHRGRLNVLANVLGKPLDHLLAEFENRPLASEVEGYGDVKYHMGYSSDIVRDEQTLHLSLAFNPSHLEIVNPVVEGTVRAKQDQLGDTLRERIVPVLLHGDAAFAGQGVVAETFTLGGLRGYGTGGTVHIIVNNQVGFTANPEESRSTRYASDIAKTVRAPVFHVNADHPEAVALTGQIALSYRQRFHKDIVIDLVCYRKHGHNELDDAQFTQPLMAKTIKRHPATCDVYAGKLAQAGVVDDNDVKGMISATQQRMREARETARHMSSQVVQSLGGRWSGIQVPDGDTELVATSVPFSELTRISDSLLQVPDGFHWHPKLEKLIRTRVTAVKEQHNLDWGTTETLALGSLLASGTNVRFSGQDAGRGTFSHRHAVYADYQTGQRFIPLQHLGPGSGWFEILNSPLSEEAVLGFEYGYSSADPWTLVVWEAQFGDFANGAQIVIDQYISSGEYKWGRMSGLVLLLPHGYEGQGPEHSSARLERFLCLCAERNMHVCNLTTPAQFFHVLRRQMLGKSRRPLIIMSPKSLLRHPSAVSTIGELTDGGFQRVLDDPQVENRDRVNRVLLCSGKIYYALAQTKRELEHRDVAIVRVEELYPYPIGEVSATLASYPNVNSVVWVQEEPRNMGAWRHLLHHFQRSLPKKVHLYYAGRDSRAVTASGSHEVHKREEEQLIDIAFRDDPRPRVVRRITDKLNKRASR